MMRWRFWLPRPLLSVFLVVLWLFLMNTLSVAHLLLGGLLGWVIPLVADPFMPRQPEVHRPGLMLRYLLVFLGDLLTSNWVVARLLMGPVERMSPGFIDYPVELNNDYAITLLASTISLTPGTVSAHYDAQRQVLMIHVLHLEDEQALVQQIKQRYEQPLKEIFQC
ncbi:Na+/H+ antiporter subunit E [Marinospirillum alkaliphilum]|uniref:Multisubunit potassium/proton antiporter, PhaE subunit n=1 Tax=Marinospirillum alkaliphilum DSM 21637 TaxID=1122209 RepID=A0A1K1ZM65_9GAMM|nr:Na+/H+ antiporter subunit E [Marinospirillum alkaliphilum]SFX75346.1 multisubunit potassium/proton antiporter, PhaE subunit [Marinospirillum alkaliphilum DSM 21637]